MRRIVWPLWESLQISRCSSTTSGVLQSAQGIQHMKSDMHAQPITGLQSAQLQPSYIRCFSSASSTNTIERKTPAFAMVPTQLDERSLKVLMAKEARHGKKFDQLSAHGADYTRSSQTLAKSSFPVVHKLLMERVKAHHIHPGQLQVLIEKATSSTELSSTLVLLALNHLAIGRLRQHEPWQGELLPVMLQACQRQGSLHPLVDLWKSMHEYGMPVIQADAETAAHAALALGDATSARNIAVLASLYMPAAGDFLEGLIAGVATAPPV